jgi:hypothetical protein
VRDGVGVRMALEARRIWNQNAAKDEGAARRESM